MRIKIIILSIFLLYAGINCEEIRVGDIKFLVDGKEEKELSSFVPLKKGDHLDYTKLKEGMENLYKTDKFSYIEVEAEKEAESFKILFIIYKKGIVGKIRFEGEKGISEGKLREAVTSLKRGGFFNENNLKRAREEVKSKLEENGFLDSEVDVVTREYKNSKEIIFKVKSGDRRKIRAFLFSEELSPEQKALRKILKLKENHPFIPFKLKRDLDRMHSYLRREGYLRAKLDYNFVKIEKDWVVVEIYGYLGERILMEFKGGEIPREILFPLWEGDTLEEWALEESKIKIQNYLKRKGFLFAEVEAEAKRAGSELRIIFHIKKGRRFRLHKIRFETEEENLKELKKFLQGYTEPSFSLWADGQLIDEYENGIKSFYRNKGYFYVDVKKEIMKRKSSVDVLFKVEDKKANFVKSIKFEGGEPYKETDLKAVSELSEGALLTDFLVERAKEKIRIFLMNQGFKNAKVEAEVEGEEGKSVLFKIQKGKKFKIKKVYISGATKTKEFILKRMIRIREGEDYSYEKIQYTLKNFQESGIFSGIKVREIEMDDGVIVIFILEEIGGYHIGLGGGYLERSGPRGSLELSYNNILGLATSGSSIIQLSPKEKRGVISFSNKSLVSLDFETVTSLWWEKEERKSFTYERRGLAISTGERKNEYSFLLFRYRIARTNLLNLSIKESAIDREYRPFYTSSLSVSYLVDLRDDPFNPTRGRYWILNFEKAFPAFGTESNFWKFSFNLQHIKNLPYDIIQNSFLRIGYIYGDASIADRFFAGGSSFKGERVDELGPKDPETGNPMGGNIIFIANTESLLPVFPWENLRLSVFFDLGNVFWREGNFKLSNFNVGSGVGLWYKTPVGPFKIYLGYNLTRPSLKRKGVILFNIGNEF